MSELVQRSKLRHFLNTTPEAATPTWALIGDGVTELEVSLSPETETEQYIHEDAQTTFLKNYAPVINGTQTARKGDDVFDFIDDISWNLPIGAGAETQILELRTWRGTGTEAKMWDCNISIDSYGGAATDPNSHTFSINIAGDATFGTFDVDDLKFTAASGASGASAKVQTLSQKQAAEALK